MKSGNVGPVQDEALANFQAITECYDVEIALIYLGDNQWNLEVRSTRSNSVESSASISVR